MPVLLISALTLALLFVGSCSREPAPAAGAWSLKLTTSGGFTGLGQGNLSVDSQNKFECSQNTPQKVLKKISGGLHSSEFKPISDAVAQLDPKGWNKPGLNVSAADAYGYKLELRTGTDNPQVFTVQWYDNTADQLPDDLKKLNEVLLRTLRTSCGGPP